MTQQDFPNGKFRFFPRWSLWSAMTSGVGMTSMTPTSRQAHSVQFIAMFCNHKLFCFAALAARTRSVPNGGGALVRGGGGGAQGLWRRLLASPLLCGSERVLVVSMEPPDDLSCLTTPGVGHPGDGAVACAIVQVHPDKPGQRQRLPGGGGAPPMVASRTDASLHPPQCTTQHSR